MNRWTAFRKIVEERYPKLVGIFRAPVEMEEIEKFEHDYNVKLPKAFYDIYADCDGEKETPPAFVFSLPLLSIEQMRIEIDGWQSIIETGLDGLEDDCTSIPKGHVKCSYASRRWIPIFYDGGGNHIGIDFDPGPNGVVGQIINFGRDEEQKYIFAKSLDDFLLRLRELLDHKGVRLQDSNSGGYTLNDLHFSDALKHVIYPEVTMSSEEMEVKEEDGFLSVWVFKNQDDEVPDNYFGRNKVDGKYQVSSFDKDFRIDPNSYSATESSKLESGSSTKIEALLRHNQFSDKFLEKAVVNATEHNIEEVQGVLTIMNLKYDPEFSGYHESKYLSFIGSYKVFEPRRW